MKDLGEIRVEIDKIDSELIELFKKRMDCAKAVGLYKKENNIPVLNQNRENEIQQQQAEINTVMNDILSRCDGVKQKYPDFDFNAEMENEQFFRLVAPLGRGGSGIDPLTAYEVMHPELKNAMVNQQINTAVANTTKAINNNLNRPQENGISNNSASMQKTDVSKMTLADIEEIKRRVQRGEKVTFD